MFGIDRMQPAEMLPKKPSDEKRSDDTRLDQVPYEHVMRRTRKAVRIALIDLDVVNIVRVRKVSDAVAEEPAVLERFQGNAPNRRPAGSSRREGAGKAHPNRALRGDHCRCK